MRLAAMAGLVVLLAGGRAEAGAAERLGAAFAAYDAGDLDGAARALEKLHDKDLVNVDYLHWLRGQVALLRGDPKTALVAFQTLAKDKGSRFAPVAPWRIADCEWALGQKPAAIKAYKKLLGSKDADTYADLAVIESRIGDLKALVIEHPAHPLAKRAEASLPPLTGDDRLERAQHLLDQHLWHEAVAELMLAPDSTRRTYWLGETLFKMRRRYADAGEMLLSVWEKMDSAEALFHGARALSRADRDDEAIQWYQLVVEKYPHSAFAEEAQYLSGWLEFNRGNYAAALAPLEESLRRYPSSKFAADALWFLGMSKYLLGKPKEALPVFTRLAEHQSPLEGGKGRYWKARALQETGDQKGATGEYRAIVTRFPFSWYALLARARLTELGAPVGPFGPDTPDPRGPPIDTKVDETLAKDPIIAGADELIAAGLDTEAGEELERGEKTFLARHDRAAALALLMDRYAHAHNHYRPWMLAIVHGEDALRGPAEGRARVWWQYAYPQAYKELVEQYQSLGDDPPYYLYSIMRKESGFNPHDLSYADAQGLLQMIPPTTARVAKVLGIDYDAGKLYDPTFNVQTGAWYIGHLLSKFGGQIPIGAGSFNCGPRPMMRWLDKNGDRPIDELVELVSYTQTREYMKKVTENYARYVYLYDGTVYEQPLTVDKAYRVDDLTY